MKTNENLRMKEKLPFLYLLFRSKMKSSLIAILGHIIVLTPINEHKAKEL